jgi:predicted GIY-YIG superfamily endonuclease
MSAGYVYVLELSRPLGNENHAARYYIGWAKQFEARLAYHRTGRGATFTRRAVEQGIELTPIILIQGDKKLERELKNWKSSKRVLRRYLNSAENLIRP